MILIFEMVWEITNVNTNINTENQPILNVQITHFHLWPDLVDIHPFAFILILWKTRFVWDRKLQVPLFYLPIYLSCVTCHVLHVTCHLSLVTCHMSQTPTPTAADTDTPPANSPIMQSSVHREAFFCLRWHSQTHIFSLESV